MGPDQLNHLVITETGPRPPDDSIFLPYTTPTPFEPQTLDELMSANAEQLAACDIARMNLLCAGGLPGAKDMDVPRYLNRLRRMAEYIRAKTAQEVPWFRAEAARANLPPGTPEDSFRVCALVRIMKDTFGLHYNRERQEAQIKKTSDIISNHNSKDMLINGLLSDERYGTCNSIPVVVVALGRRLGYPLYVTANRWHVLARWEGRGLRFNIDASCPGNSLGACADDYFRSFPHPWPEIDKRNDYYLKNFTPADDLALFLMSRAWVLQDNLRFEESIPFWARACHLAPAEPQYPYRAMGALWEAVYFRKNGRPVAWKVRKSRRTPRDFFEDCNLKDVFPSATVAQGLSIIGHFHEVRGSIGGAMKYYRDALEVEPDNPDYKADFERYKFKSRKELVRAHVRNREIVRKAAPGVKLPPLKEIIRQFKKSLTAPVPAGTPPPEGWRTAISLQQQTLGIQAMNAGRWAEAQAHFARGHAAAPEDQKRIFAVYLHNSISKEIRGIAPLEPQPPRPPSEDDDDEDENPILKLHPYVQALVWSKRGIVLAGLGRFVEAEQAFSQAMKLSPENEEYPKHQKAMIELEAQRKAQAEPKFPLSNPTRVPRQDIYVTSAKEAFAVRDGTRLPPVVIPPRAFFQPQSGR